MREKDIATLKRDRENRASFYSHVGQAISLWSSMEGQIVQIATALIDTSFEKTGLVFYSTNFYSWLIMIDELFLMDERFKDIRSDWTKLSDRLRTLNDTRVRLAHNTIWGTEEAIKGVSRLTPPKYDTRSKSRKHTPLTEAEIEKFSCDSLDLDAGLGDLFIAMKKLDAEHLAKLAKPAPPQDGQQ